MRGIITADWHIRPDTPRCRLDQDWEATQRAAIGAVVTAANERDSDLVIVGDLFDTPSVPARLVTMVIEELSKLNHVAYFLAGNHDLPYHEAKYLSLSSLGILVALAKHHSKIVFNLSKKGIWCNFNGKERGTDEAIRFVHTLVFPNAKSMPPTEHGITAQELLAQYPKAKWIFTGDMHRAFHVESKGRHVVNPGCLLRQAADYIDYAPSVYYVDTDKGLVEAITIPDEADMVTDAYLRAEEERDTRISAFVEGIKKGEGFSLSITDNIERAIAKNKKRLAPDTIAMIRRLVEDNA